MQARTSQRLTGPAISNPRYRGRLTAAHATYVARRGQETAAAASGVADKRLPRALWVIIGEYAAYAVYEFAVGVLSLPQEIGGASIQYTRDLMLGAVRSLEGESNIPTIFIVIKQLDDLGELARMLRRTIRTLPASTEESEIAEEFAQAISIPLEEGELRGISASEEA